MFNLNIPTTHSLLGVDNGRVCTTPRTPEILNSLIAMTNPLDNYSFALIPGGNNASMSLQDNKQNICQDSCHSNSSSSPLDSPAGCTQATPSVQQTCSQLIKAGLKLSIQSKRKMSSGDSSSGTDTPAGVKQKYSVGQNGDTSEDDNESRTSPHSDLTPEDEDRRRRRRERNKIAATKCRMKKRERTLNLVSESEQLESQNIDLKSQVRNLETERRKLFDMLHSHGDSCVRPGGYNPPERLCQSPACKYLSDIGFSEDDLNNHQNDVKPASQQIPPMNTIKYTRNGIRQNQTTPTNNRLIVSPQAVVGPSLLISNNELSAYCNNNNISTKKLHDLDYLTLTVPQTIIATGNTTVASNHHNHQDRSCTNHNSNNCIKLHSLQNQVKSSTKSVIGGLAAEIKTDYIPNCESSNDILDCANSNNSLVVTLDCLVNDASTATTLQQNDVGAGDDTTDFVLKSELIDAQSPYTTVQSADRFLFETDCGENFDIKHNITNLSTHNNNNNNNNTLDFQTHHMAPISNSCQVYENLLIKSDFLADQSELLAQFTEENDSELTDLDSGTTSSFVHVTSTSSLV